MVGQQQAEIYSKVERYKAAGPQNHLRFTVSLKTILLVNALPFIYFNAHLAYSKIMLYDYNYASLSSELPIVKGHDGCSCLNLTVSSGSRAISKHVEKEPPFQMLLGIFSMDSPSEKKRRELIRKTYLSLFPTLRQHNFSKIREDDSLVYLKRHTQICSLQEYISKANTTTNSTSFHTVPADRMQEECQLLYTFVVGAADDPDAPSELLDSESRPLALDRAKNLTEPDVVYLNIRENMNDGKTPTWFKYASSSAVPAEINLIAKVDSDTLIFPDVLVTAMEDIIERADGSLLYGGKSHHGGKEHMIRGLRPYMQGGFYFMHRELAQEITSHSRVRTNIINRYSKLHGRRHEDIEVGELVNHLAGGKYRFINFMDIIDRRAWLHGKPGRRRAGQWTNIKAEDGFKNEWNKYLVSLLTDEVLI